VSSKNKRRFTQIGLDRLIRLKWLEYIASQVLVGNDDETIISTLQAHLMNSFKSRNTNVRGSLNKTITILTKVWMRVPSELESFKITGLELLRHYSKKNQLIIHWGMVIAVYPFWAAVAAQVGRLIRLQGSASTMQVQRRLRELYGERETVSRRVRYVLRSYVDWGVLHETTIKGTYNAGLIFSVDDNRLNSWLIEASLHARANGSASLKELLDSPSLFPFRFQNVSIEDIATSSPNLGIVKLGLDNDLIILQNKAIQ
jgi:hypothetical protein